MCENEQKPELEPEPWNKRAPEPGANLLKTKSSRARAMFMEKRAAEPELWHFYDGSAALK